MNEQTPGSPGYPANPATPLSPAPRRRRLLAAAAVAAGLAVVGGVAGAVAAVVSHGSSSTAAARDGAAMLFFPAAGQAGGGGGAAGAPGATSDSYGPAAGTGGAVAAPAMALDQRAGAPGVALSTVAPGFAYPSYGCGGPAPAQVQGDGITASAMVQVPLGGSAATTYMLNLGVQAQNGDDVTTALATVRSRLDAIRAALHRAGIADAQISAQNLNVWANGGPKPVNAGVNAGLIVTITDAALVDPAITAAAGAGASSLNLWSSGGASSASPSDAQLHSAITKATAQARSMAQAEADGLGLSLGTVRASTVQPPSICPWAAGGPQLVVTVSVTYAVK